MTASELIEKLKAVDPDTLILVTDGCGLYDADWEVRDVRLGKGGTYDYVDRKDHRSTIVKAVVL